MKVLVGADIDYKIWDIDRLDDVFDGHHKIEHAEILSTYEDQENIRKECTYIISNIKGGVTGYSFVTNNCQNFAVLLYKK